MRWNFLLEKMKVNIVARINIPSDAFLKNGITFLKLSQTVLLKN